MASIDTAERTAQLQAKIQTYTQPSFRPLQGVLRYARFGVITLTGDSDAQDDDIVLGSLGIGGIIVPEHCRLVGLSGSVAGAFTLEKVAPDGTVTALTGVATLAADGTSVAFARKAGSVTGAKFNADDVLQLTITTPTALSATDEIELCLAYISEEEA